MKLIQLFIDIQVYFIVFQRPFSAGVRHLELFQSFAFMLLFSFNFQSTWKMCWQIICAKLCETIERSQVFAVVCNRHNIIPWRNSNSATFVVELEIIILWLLCLSRSVANNADWAPHYSNRTMNKWISKDYWQFPTNFEAQQDWLMKSDTGRMRSVANERLSEQKENDKKRNLHPQTQTLLYIDSEVWLWCLNKRKQLFPLSRQLHISQRSPSLHLAFAFSLLCTDILAECQRRIRLCVATKQ